MTTPPAWDRDPYVVGQPESVPFWKAAEQDEFLGKRCTRCTRFHWYPRAICPHCSSPDTEWCRLSGEGTLYAFSTLLRTETPYTVAYVQLAEGPCMLTRLVRVDEEKLSIGMPVRVAFERTPEGRKAPIFTLAADDAR
jgi:uncharacterized protein